MKIRLALFIGMLILFLFSIPVQAQKTSPEASGSATLPGTLNLNSGNESMVGITIMPVNPSGQLKEKATPHSVTLTWVASTVPAGAPPVTSYAILRGTAAGGESTTPIATSTGTSYTDTSVVAGTVYFYVVYATNSVGNSANSNEVSATIPNQVVPNAPVLSGTAQ